MTMNNDELKNYVDEVIKNIESIEFEGNKNVEARYHLLNLAQSVIEKVTGLRAIHRNARE